MNLKDTIQFAAVYILENLDNTGNWKKQKAMQSGYANIVTVNIPMSFFFPKFCYFNFYVVVVILYLIVLYHDLLNYDMKFFLRDSNPFLSTSF